MPFGSINRCIPTKGGTEKIAAQGCEMWRHPSLWLFVGPRGNCKRFDNPVWQLKTYGREMSALPCHKGFDLV